MIADTPRNRLAALLHDPTYGMPDFRDCLDFADRLIAAGVTFATPRPAEIDVERLARAMHEDAEEEPCPEWPDCPERMHWVRQAERIARIIEEATNGR